MDLINNILTAPVYDVAKKTPLDQFNQLSETLQNNIFTKREDLQPVFSFKCRGAYNKLAKLVESNNNIKGVIAASAGNHAQGLALSAKRMKVKAIIVMPKITPKIKINAVKRFGGEFVEVIIFGDNFDDAAAHAKEIQQAQQLHFVHPFDDLDVIAGQGTVGKEIIEQKQHIDAIFVPVGGGGLLAGVASYVKYLKPNIKIIGVEHVDSASMSKSIQENKQITLNHAGVFADGISVKRPGDNTFKITQELVDEIICVNTDEICAAINDIFNETRNIVEPSGATALAGLKKWVKQNKVKNKNLVNIISGANMNFDSLRYITERTAIGAQTECLLSVIIPEKKHSFKKLCSLISGRAVTEFNYRYHHQDTANILIGIAIQRGQAEIDEIIDLLQSNGYQVNNLSDNSIAKLHLRYMIGGKKDKTNELLFRFEFPERPGALLYFLDKLGPNNITLFNYRNHGADYGRVLVGIEPADSSDTLYQTIDQIGYYYSDETENPAYRLFL